MKHDTSTSRTYIFPEPDLLHTLINAYFTEINILWPLLHRPTFENSVAEGLHHKDSGFAGVVLLVCATGSRFVSDPRVLSDSSSLLSAGWKYFNQVQIGENALLEPPSLFNLQTRCVRGSILIHVRYLILFAACCGISSRVVRASNLLVNHRCRYPTSARRWCAPTQSLWE
jgi:hypothetical protein